MKWLWSLLSFVQHRVLVTHLLRGGGREGEEKMEGKGGRGEGEERDEVRGKERGREGKRGGRRGMEESR